MMPMHWISHLMINLFGTFRLNAALSLSSHWTLSSLNIWTYNVSIALSLAVVACSHFTAASIVQSSCSCYFIDISWLQIHTKLLSGSAIIIRRRWSCRSLHRLMNNSRDLFTSKRHWRLVIGVSTVSIVMVGIELRIETGHADKVVIIALGIANSLSNC